LAGIAGRIGRRHCLATPDSAALVLTAAGPKRGRFEMSYDLINGWEALAARGLKIVEVG